MRKLPGISTGCIVTFFLCLLMKSIQGQQLSMAGFTRYSVTEGLSNNTVTGLAQDSTGFVWIATSYGLNRYNGSQFVQYHSNEDSLSLASEELASMWWVDKKRLGIHNAGLHIVDTRTGKTRNLFVPFKDKKFQYKFNVLESTKGDEQGNIYMLTRSGFYHFDKDYRLVFRFDYYNEEQVSTEHFFFGRYMYWLDAKRLLVVSINGLYVYDISRRQLKKMEAADCPIMSEFLDYVHQPYQFFQAKPGCFFVMKLNGDSIVYVNVVENKKAVSRMPVKVLKDEFFYRSRLTTIDDTSFYITGHMSGFFRFSLEPRSGKVHMDAVKYFPSTMCNVLMQDKEKNLWIGTNAGVLRQDQGRSGVQTATLPDEVATEFPNIRFDDVVVNKDKVYAATRGYGGVVIFNKNNLQYEGRVRMKYSELSNSVYAMVKVDENRFLLGTGDPLFMLDMRTNKEQVIFPPGWSEGDWTSDMYKDSRGKIWITAYHLYRYDPLINKFNEVRGHPRLLAVPFGIEEDRDGNIWMAGHGIARFNVQSDSFDILIDSFPYIKMHDKQVNSLAIDKYNRVWFNSTNNGLIGYDIRSRKFTHVTRNDGLPEDNITSMLAVGDQLWITCYSAIACMDLRTNKIVSFGREDGLPQMPVFKGGRLYYDSTEKQLYVGFTHAVSRFNPHEMLRKKSAPSLFIENLVIGGKKSNYLPGANISTAWNENEIMVKIGTINFSDGYSQRFAYRIYKNESTPWIQLGDQPSFSISNLSPGPHRIQVKSFSINNRWPAQLTEINVKVLPPFWLKEWFIFSMSALLLVGLYLFIRWRTNRARRKEMEKTNVEKLKADHYKNQFELEHISNYFSSSLADKKSIDDVLWDVAKNLIGKMNYVDCMIYLWNDDKTKMVQKAAFGPKGAPEFISINVFDVVPGQGVVGHVISTRQPVLIHDTRKDPRYRVDEEFRLSEVCVPIIHNDELLGIIDSEHYDPNYFTERDIKILTTIGTLIANKIRQIESEATLEVKQQELVTINEQLAEARLSALQAQMNPHFVFNALNSIKRMILESDNEKASRYLSKFASMIRMTLNHSKEVFVTLEENIEYIRAYLDMEKLRFDDSFNYDIEVDEGLDAAEIYIPSLMIQPLVENAIWHGLLQSAGDKFIRISFLESGEQIRCEIEDNGIGIRHSENLKAIHRSAHQSVGLENLRKRVKIMNEKYNIDCSLAIVDLADESRDRTGTKVILQFNKVNL